MHTGMESRERGAKSKHNGFTLLEMMVALTVRVENAAIAIPA